MGDFLGETPVFIKLKPTSSEYLMIQNNLLSPCESGAASNRLQIYQLSFVGYWPTKALTDNGVSGNDSGEKA